METTQDTWNSNRWEARPEDPSFGNTATLVKYALPLVFSNAGIVIQQFIDRMFLAWHAPESVAGAGMAGMICICFISFFAATTGFTSVFAAQYIGAQRPERLGPTIWQGGYLSMLFGGISAALAFAAYPLFNAIGHSPLVRQAEVDYFVAIMLGGFFFVATAAVMGFFIGKGETRKVMIIQIAGILANLVLDYGLIFGNLGMPNWGVAGAAWATVAAQAIMLAAGVALYARRRYRAKYGTMNAGFEYGLTKRILRYGAPNGLRSVVELVMWSLFLGLIGRIGDMELAVSNVAFSINSLAWQPMVGVGMAVSMLVGKAQGAYRPDKSRQVMVRGFIITEVWEILGAVLFIFFPTFLLSFFFQDLPPGQAHEYYEMGSRLLWFVAAYCLIDSINIVFAQGLIGAGDSWWTSKITLLLTALTMAGMLFLNHLDARLEWYWLCATLYIAASATAWLLRYKGGKWESMRVVETVVVETPISE